MFEALLAALPQISGAAAPFLGGGPSSKSTSQSSVSNSLSVAVNPSFAVVNGGGTAYPTSGGDPSASSSSSPSQTATEFLPTSGTYGQATYPARPYNDISTAPAASLGIGGLLSDPIVWLGVGAVAFFAMMDGKKGRR